MNSLDFLVGLSAAILVCMFVLVGYQIGYKHGHGEGFVRGRNIAKALRDAELTK